jgi:hypothetical protein
VVLIQPKRYGSLVLTAILSAALGAAAVLLV